jgi:uncharacterized RDD family membrane protein YckC
MLPPSITPVQFFNAGNLVTAGLQLYRQHFSSFLRFSFAAHAWFVLPLVLLFGSFFLVNAGNLAALLVLIVPASLAIFVYGLAKYQAFAAAISRLSYHDLLQTPETPTQTSRYVNTRVWGFLLIGFLLGLIYLAVAIGLYILILIVGVIVFAIIGGAAFQATDPSDPAVVGAAIAVVGGIGFIIGIPSLLLVLWLVARFFIAEVTFAIEPETLAGSALSRSWALTRQNSWRVVLLLLAIFTVLFPLQSLIQVFSTLLQGVALTVNSQQSPGIYAAAVTISYVLALLLSILTLPLWQSTKAVLYYDLRSRREGMGLDLNPEPAPDSSAPDRSPEAPAVLQLFRHVKLVTPESVELEFILAGIGSRTLAMLVDYGIIFIGGLLFWVVFGFFSYQLLRYLEQTAIDYSGLPLWLLAVGMLLSFIFTTGYFAGFEVLRQGQTPGKRWANIRVVRDDGRPVGLAQAVLRSLLQPIDFLLFLGAFMIVWGKREKRIGDWAAGTLVIQENRAGKQAIVLSSEARRLSTELPATTHLQQLQPIHFAVISEYLQRRSLMNTNARKDLSLKLARQIRTLIQLEIIPQELTSDQFLEAVYLAYQAQFSAY